MRNHADIWKPASTSLGGQFKVLLTGAYGEVARMSPTDLVTWAAVGTGSAPSTNANGNLWPAAVSALPGRFKVLLVGAYGETARMSASDLVAQFGIVGTSRPPMLGIAGKNLWPPAFSTLPPRFRVVLTGNAGETATMSIDAVVTAGGGGNPLPQFITDLKAIAAPDLLVIADSYGGSDGDIIASAPESSGNNNPMVQATLAKRPKFVKVYGNGRAAYDFSGGGDLLRYLQAPFGQAGDVTIAMVSVFARKASGSNRIGSITTGADGTDAGATTPIPMYMASEKLGGFYNGGGPQQAAAIADTVFHAGAGWISAAGTAHSILDGGSVVDASGLSTSALLGGNYATIGGINAGAFGLNGVEALAAFFRVAPSTPTIQAFLARCKTYYNTP